MVHRSRYLVESQRIKELISSHPNILQAILNFHELKEIKPGTGFLHNTYRLGNIDDIFIAIRGPLLSGSFESSQADLEWCAQKYEEYSGNSLRVPNFAIGTLVEGWIPILLVEDLTRGGVSRVDDNYMSADNYSGFIEPSHTLCYYDFDLRAEPNREKLKEKMLSSPRFFHPDYLLKLEHVS